MEGPISCAVVKKSFVMLTPGVSELDHTQAILIVCMHSYRSRLTWKRRVHLSVARKLPERLHNVTGFKTSSNLFQISRRAGWLGGGGGLVSSPLVRAGRVPANC